VIAACKEQQLEELSQVGQMEGSSSDTCGGCGRQTLFGLWMCFCSDQAAAIRLELAQRNGTGTLLPVASIQKASPREAGPAVCYKHPAAESTTNSNNLPEASCAPVTYHPEQGKCRKCTWAAYMAHHRFGSGVCSQVRMQ
jgi:hypothetical protein